ncbi:MAG: four helix bundle protein [Polyangiaceae bacterium]
MQHPTHHGTLRVIDEMIAIAREVGAMARQVANHDNALTDQMRRAWTSAANNASEGQHQRGNKRLNRMCDAMGSARETRTAILLAEAYGYVDSARALALAQRIDGCVAQLYSLAHPRR